MKNLCDFANICSGDKFKFEYCNNFIIDKSNENDLVPSETDIQSDSRSSDSDNSSENVELLEAVEQCPAQFPVPKTRPTAPKKQQPKLCTSKSVSNDRPLHDPSVYNLCNEQLEDSGYKSFLNTPSSADNAVPHNSNNSHKSNDDCG